jgi:hypothetical protein
MAPRREKGKPTIEQRLDAITETLELVAGMQLTVEKSLKQTAKNLERLSLLGATVMTSHEARIRKLEGRR